MGTTTIIRNFRQPVRVIAPPGVPPTIDGTSTGSTNLNPGFNTVLSTSLSNDIIVALIFHNTRNSVGAPRACTSVDSATLGTFNRRGSQVSYHSGFTGTPYIALDVFWALATSPLSSEVISASFDGNFDNGAGVFFGVNGCGNLSSPWDINGSLPGVVSDASGTSTPSIQPVSTNARGTLIFGFTGTANEGGDNNAVTAGGDFSFLAERREVGGSSWSRCGAVYKGVSSAQANSTVPFGHTWGGWIGLAHALVGT